jgi:tRNA G18 (ribose-2'-O)-methylase SpoU
VYYAEVEKINNKNTYNKFENEEINIFKLNHKQLKKINSSGTLQNVLTKVSIYEYFNKIKKS